MSNREDKIEEALHLKDFESAAVLSIHSYYRGMEEAQLYATLALAQSIRRNGGTSDHEDSYKPTI